MVHFDIAGGEDSVGDLRDSGHQLCKQLHHLHVAQQQVPSSVSNTTTTSLDQLSAASGTAVEGLGRGGGGGQQRPRRRRRHDYENVSSGTTRRRK